MNDELQDMIQVSCEEAITPDIEAQLETDEQAEARALEIEADLNAQYAFEEAFFHNYYKTN